MSEEEYDNEPLLLNCKNCGHQVFEYRNKDENTLSCLHCGVGHIINIVPRCNDCDQLIINENEYNPHICDVE